MALKVDRDFYCQEDISYVWGGTATATRGGVASILTATSGVGLTGTKTSVEYKADPSGAKPVGVVLQDIVDVDKTKYALVPDRFEVVSGDPVTVIRKGWVVTNKILGTPAAGGAAYASWSGNISPLAQANTDAPQIGRFETTKDADGFVKVYIDI